VHGHGRGADASANQGSELCLAIVGPSKQGPLPEKMWVAAACHTEMARQLAALRAQRSNNYELITFTSRSKLHG
jgi:hypothetical protein